MIKWILRHLMWLIIRFMSALHVDIDHLAHHLMTLSNRIDTANLSVWKRNLIKALEYLQTLNGWHKDEK